MNYLVDTNYGVWEQLVTGTPVVGKNGHDARLVAAMTVHGLTHLLTFNAQDFRQFPGITVTTSSPGASWPMSCGSRACASSIVIVIMSPPSAERAIRMDYTLTRP